MKDILEMMRGTSLEDSLSEQASRVDAFEERYDRLLDLKSNKRIPDYRKRYLLETMMHEAENPSDFPILMGTVLDRQLLAMYTAATPDVFSYVYRGTQRDFRPQNLIGIYGLQGQLSKVALRGPYEQDEVLAEGKVQISVAKFGALFAFGWETMINDDLGAFTTIAKRLALRCTRTEYLQATSLFVDANGPHASLYGAPIAHPIDAKNVTNKFTGATATFGIDNLGKGAAAMRRFVDADGEPVIFEGFDLVVPPALEIPMLQALNPANVIQSGGDSTAGAKAIIRSSSNTVPQLNIVGHVNPYLPTIDKSGNADKTWYLFGHISDLQYAVRMNFLAGHETPEIVMKSPNKVSLGGGLMSAMDGDFESDSLNWRVRDIMGGIQVDPRFGAAFVGA